MRVRGISSAVMILFFFMVANPDQCLSTDEEKVVVLGDVEGQWKRLVSFMKNSGAFIGDETGAFDLKPGYKFIFIGDSVDKGPASLRILRTLTGLKKKFKEQVVLIMGNRDTNKLRLTHELSSEAMRGPPNEDVATQGFQEWLFERGLGDEYQSDRVTRLKWILDKSMWSPQAFEFRRQELADEQKRAVSEFAVFNSFLSDLDPVGGAMAEFLKLAQAAHFDQANRALFVHGGLTPESYGFIPGLEHKVMDLKTWIGGMNDWVQEQVREGIFLRTGSRELIKYQQPVPGTMANQASIIYGRNFDVTGNPLLIPEELQNLLLEQGVDTLVVGHTPVGEMPVLISNGKFRILFVDNSASTHGDSASISFDGGVLRVSAKSPLRPSGNRIVYEHVLGGDSMIGRRGARGWIIGYADGLELQFRIEKSSGYKPVYETVPNAMGPAGPCVEAMGEHL